MEFPKSIRWRLQLWHGVILSVLVVSFGITAYQLQRTDRLRQVDEELLRRSFVLTRLFSPQDAEDRDPDHGPQPLTADIERSMPPDVAKLFAENGQRAFYYLIWTSDGRLRARSVNAPANTVTPARQDLEQWQTYQTRGTMRELVRYTTLGRCVLIGRSIRAELADLRQLAWWLTAAGGAVMVFGFGGGWWAATRAIWPLKHVINTAAKIGHPSERIDVPEAGPEIAHLAAVLNSTFARLEAAFTRQKQFTADAAHELRTPLTVIISEAQTVLARERDAGEYREALEACLATAQQMRHLTESLLQLARSDSGQDQSLRTDLDLASVALEAIVHVGLLASTKKIKIHRDLEPAPAFGSADQLKQVVGNLLSNAIEYTNQFGNIWVRTRTENGWAVLTVEDTGPGISEEDLPHIFQRFYRTDKARSRSRGRSGLGLPISQAIVESHGGTIEAKSQLGVGTTFLVRLPRDPSVTNTSNKGELELADEDVVVRRQ